MISLAALVFHDLGIPNSFEKVKENWGHGKKVVAKS